MLNKILAIIILSTSFTFLQAQFVLSECPNEVICIEVDQTYQVTIPVPSGVPSEVFNCIGENNSQMSMIFENSSEQMHIEAIWDTGDEINIGLVSDCGEENYCLSSVECDNSGSVSLDVSLILGRTYILYIDACDNISPIDVDVTFAPSAQNELFTEVFDISIESSCTIDEISYLCFEEEFLVTLGLEEYEYWNGREGVWEIIYNGPMSGRESFDNLDGMYLFLEYPGEYEICFDAVTFDCYPFYAGEWICTTVIVGQYEVEYNEYDVCQHDLDQGWVPDENWTGDPITEPGQYEIEETDCNCIEPQTITVNRISERETEIEVELCPQDYPYDFMGQEEYDYDQRNIEDVVFLEGGSNVQDYSGNACDSIIYLILVNERPQERCSSCNLPLSLEKGKIVVCLPFDDGAVDVSGRNTIVYENGVNYDDNGSSSNDFWEAVFDGDEDYVTIPHIDDLNTSVFSFNFQFNKDEAFENGDLETLVSKGDHGKGNMRYDVCVRKVDDSTFDLVATFQTSGGKVFSTISGLRNYTWYDVAYVIEEDVISVYIDGFIVDEVYLDENLIGNEEDFFIGTLLEYENKIQFYNGRIDNFKYWKQKLSGQDVLFLHFPEKEFEVQQDYFLSCCDQADFRDIIINKNNPLDSLIIPNASPTGYDSVYILSYIQNDQAPQIDQVLAQDDILIQYQQECQEFCQSTAQWNLDASTLFSDNCNALTISQSHVSPVVLDENISFVEVTYTATDDCGQSTSHSFGLELECLPSTAIDVPEENVFSTNVNGTCIDPNTNEICKFSEIKFTPGFLAELDTETQSYDANAQFSVVMSIDGVSESFSQDQYSSGISFSQLNEEGTYTICIESVSSDCETVVSTFCETISIKGSVVVDFGTIVSCRDDIESSLPTDISQEMKNLILSNPQETKITLSEIDDCGCEFEESIKLEINENVIEFLDVEICEDDTFNGYSDAGTYIENYTSKAGCDSTLTIELKILPNSIGDVYAEICEGESYKGHEESGTYTETLVAKNGCDSILMIQLNVQPKSYVDAFVQICPDSTYMGFSEAGNYELINTNVLGCDSITNLNIELLDALDPACFVSGINDIIEESITIYPNPVSEQLNIQDNINIVETAVYNIEGKKLLRNYTTKSIDVSSLESGIYILKIIDATSKVKMVKFVKS